MQGLNKFKEQINAEVEKVKGEKKKQMVKEEANEIIKHIESVCDEEYDNLLAQDHKSFIRMWRFVTEKAREYAINNVAMIKSDKVFGWIDEYVGRDDKEEVEKEEKKTSVEDTIKKVQEEIQISRNTEQISIFDL